MRTVTDIQRVLRRLGYDLGPDGVDGEAGDFTLRALAKYQGDNGLALTGRADRNTLASMFPEPQRTTIMGNIFSGLLGKLFDWQLIQSYIRNALVAFGGSFVANGMITNVELNTIVGALMIVFGLLFSMISGLQKKAAMDVVKAVEASDKVTLVPASTTEKPRILVTRP